jgi:hypothetical protein
VNEKFAGEKEEAIRGAYNEHRKVMNRVPSFHLCYPLSLICVACVVQRYSRSPRRPRAHSHPAAALIYDELRIKISQAAERTARTKNQPPRNNWCNKMILISFEAGLFKNKNLSRL